MNADILKQIRELASAITWCADTDNTDNTDEVEVFISGESKQIPLKDFIKLISIPNGLEPYVYLMDQNLYEVIGKYAAHIMGKHIIVDNDNQTSIVNYGDPNWDKIYLNYTRHDDEGEHYVVLEPPQITCNSKSQLPSNPFIENFIQRDGNGQFNVQLSTGTQPHNDTSYWMFYQELLPSKLQFDLKLIRQLACAITWRTLAAYKPGLNKNISTLVNGTPMTITGTQFVKLMSVGFSEPCVRIDKDTLPLIGEAAADIIGKTIHVTDQDTGQTATYGSKYDDELKLGISDTPFASTATSAKALSAATPASVPSAKALSAAPLSAADAKALSAAVKASPSVSSAAQPGHPPQQYPLPNEEIQKMLNNDDINIRQKAQYALKKYNNNYEEAIKALKPPILSPAQVKAAYMQTPEYLKNPDIFVNTYVQDNTIPLLPNPLYKDDSNGRNLNAFSAIFHAWRVISTVGEGNCLTHAFLQCLSSTYGKITGQGYTNKSKVAKAFRLSFSSDSVLARDKLEYEIGDGLIDLSDIQILDYSRLFNVITVVFEQVVVNPSQDMANPIVAHNFQRGLSNPTDKVIFIHADGGHYSSVMLPTGNFTMTLNDAQQIEELQKSLT